MYESSNGYFLIVAGNILPSNGTYRVAIYSYGYEKEEQQISIDITSANKNNMMSEQITLNGTKVQNVDFEVRIGKIRNT